MARPVPDMDARFARETGQAGEIAALVEPVVEELGFDLVRVKVSGKVGGTVQVMVERQGAPVTVEDCTQLSRRLSPLLDAYDPMPGQYHLEVSSPGIDRPLVRPRDFETWAGFRARVTMKELIEGRRRFKGEIEGFENGEVRLGVDLEGYAEPQSVGLPLELIDQAKLILDDSLIRASLAKGPSK